MNYAIPGHQEISSVKIDSDKPVSELKNKLKTSDDALALINVRDIMLFKVNIIVPKVELCYKELTKSISTCAINFKMGEKLWNPVLKLSSIQGGFPEGNLHILVKVPAHESFSSSPGCDVAEIVLLLTTPCNNSLITITL